MKTLNQTPNAKAQHTPEPWPSPKAHRFKGENSEAFGVSVGSFMRGHFVFGDATEQDATRIVACVNACAGMADPSTEIAALRAALAKAKGEA